MPRNLSPCPYNCGTQHENGIPTESNCAEYARHQQSANALVSVGGGATAVPTRAADPYDDHDHHEDDPWEDAGLDQDDDRVIEMREDFPEASPEQVAKMIELQDDNEESDFALSVSGLDNNVWHLPHGYQLHHANGDDTLGLDEQAEGKPGYIVVGNSAPIWYNDEIDEALLVRKANEESLRRVYGDSKDDDGNPDIVFLDGVNGDYAVRATNAGGHRYTSDPLNELCVSGTDSGIINEADYERVKQEAAVDYVQSEWSDGDGDDAIADLFGERNAGDAEILMPVVGGPPSDEDMRRNIVDELARIEPEKGYRSAVQHIADEGKSDYAQRYRDGWLKATTGFDRPDDAVYSVQRLHEAIQKSGAEGRGSKERLVRTYLADRARGGLCWRDRIGAAWDDPREAEDAVLAHVNAMTPDQRTAAWDDISAKVQEQYGAMASPTSVFND